TGRVLREYKGGPARADPKQSHARPYVNSTRDCVPPRGHKYDALTRTSPGCFIDGVLKGSRVLTGNNDGRGIVGLRSEHRSSRSSYANPKQAKKSHEHSSCISTVGRSDYLDRISEMSNQR